MANLDFLAAGVQDDPDPIKRDVQRSRNPNPFEEVVSMSWDAREYNEDKDAFVGATKRVNAQTDEQAQAIVRAIRLAGKNLRIGIRLSAPSERYEVDVPVLDENGAETGETTTVTRTRFLAGTIRFSTKELTERNGRGSEDAESGEEDAA